MIRLSEIVNAKRQTRTIGNPEFKKEYDVIVCGLGSAGAYAALFCAENGLSVLGVETLTCVGGTHTAGGVWSHYFGCPGGRYYDLEKDVVIFSKRYTATPTESRKLVVEKALVKQGVEILYNTSVCGVYLEENQAKGLSVLTENGIENFGAKIILDCTGEAHIANMAGCETQCGRDSDGQMQPYSLVSLIKKPDRYKFNNRDFGRVNQFDQWELSSAVLFSRTFEITEKKADITYIAQSPMLGIREGRRIIADEMAHLKDLFADKQTKTPMFYSYSDLDKHGWDIAFDSETLGDWAIGANLGAYNVTVAVPYQALLPKGFDGILVPCRALGVDRDISSCVRMILDMKKSAEVAAEWATLAVKENKKLREVSYEKIKAKLLKSGCLDETYNRSCRVDGGKNWDGSPLVPRDVTWITDPEKLEDRLKTKMPGEGIWSAKRMGEAALPTLRKYLISDDENLKKHTAFALASLGNSEGTDLLREMVYQRDGLMLEDCRKNNNLRGCMAIYWLGRLGDREILGELIRLICNPNEIENLEDLKTTRYHIADYHNVYFQYMSQSLMALVRIGDMHKDLRPQIEQGFKDAFSTDDYYYRITKKPLKSSEGNMTKAIQNIAFSTIRRWNDQK